MVTRTGADNHERTPMRAEIAPSLDALTEKIIGSAFAVSHTLGHGFLEMVYKNALGLELIASGLVVAKEKPFPVHYRGQHVGMYVADIVVNDTVIVELKVVDALSAAHSAQVLNYLKASRSPVGLLFNFGKPRVEVKRVIL
jgi:GxxExxY protein